MSMLISADEAYHTYKDLNLSKTGTKSANFEVIQAILNRYSVEIIPKPSELVCSKEFSVLILRYRVFDSTSI